MPAAFPESLPLQELHQRAAQEAAHFMLPEDWATNRGIRFADAVDTAGTQNRDDAFSLSTNEQGSILHISIADTGSFIPEALPATSEIARQRGQRRYACPMLPWSVLGALSLSPPLDRPAITLHIPIDKDFSVVREPAISRDRVIVNALSYEEFDSTLVSDSESRFHEYTQMAHGLFLHRQNIEIDLSDENDPNALARRHDLGRFVVREFMTVANSAAAHYMDANDIPAVYLGNLPGGGKSAIYSREPRPLKQLRLPMYMNFASPLRRFTDFINHANLVAHLEDAPYPYPSDAINTMLPQLNANLRENYDPTFIESFSEPRVRKLGASAFKLLDKLSRDELQETDLANIFFGPLRATDADREHLREQALEYLKSHPQLANNVLSTALEKDWIQKEVAMGANGRPTTHHFTITDQRGERYDYSTRRKGATPQALTIALLGRVAGIELNPLELTEELRVEARLQAALRDADKFMRTLDKKTDIDYAAYAEEDANSGEFRARAAVTLNGTVYYQQGYGANSKEAVQSASSQLIRELDLVETPPKPKIPLKKK